MKLRFDYQLCKFCSTDVIPALKFGHCDIADTRTTYRYDPASSSHRDSDIRFLPVTSSNGRVSLSVNVTFAQVTNIADTYSVP